MNASDDGPARRLATLIEEGANRCVGQLAKISGWTWSVETVSVGGPWDHHLNDYFPLSPEDHHGSWFTMPGAGLLVIFPSRAGMLVTDRFTSAHSDVVDALPRRDPQALGEIGNILVNSFVTPLARCLDEDVIVSAPAIMTATKREMLLRAVAKLGSRQTALSGYVRLASPSSGCDFSIAILVDGALLARLR